MTEVRHDRMAAPVDWLRALDKQSRRTPREKESLRPKIESTDCQIDRLAYELCGLREEGVRIVEGVTPPCAPTLMVNALRRAEDQAALADVRLDRGKDRTSRRATTGSATCLLSCSRSSRLVMVRAAPVYPGGL